MKRNSYKERGVSKIGSLLFLLAVVGLGLFFLFFVVFGTLIPPGQFGVRLVKFGPFRGYSRTSLQPGLHWGLPGDFYTVVYKIPNTIQMLEFHQQEVEQSSGSELASLPALEVQTADRAVVDVDITILTKMWDSAGEEDGIVHKGPVDLVTKVGAVPEAWVNHIRRSAEEHLKRALSDIASGEFYNPDRREKQLKKAQEAMQGQLADVGIKVESVLLRRYSYRENRIDDAIFLKNLQDQEKRLNMQASKLAEAQASLEQVAAKWDADISTLKVEGDNKARVVRSEGDLYQAKKVSEADLEVAKARAEVDRLRASVLAESRGAQIYVGREISQLLSSIKGGIVSDVDPYNLDHWMTKLGVASATSTATGGNGK